MAKSMRKEKVTTAQQQVDAWATQNRKNSEWFRNFVIYTTPTVSEFEIYNDATLIIQDGYQNK